MNICYYIIILKYLYSNFNLKVAAEKLFALVHFFMRKIKSLKLLPKCKFISDMKRFST